MKSITTTLRIPRPRDGNSVARHQFFMLLAMMALAGLLLPVHGRLGQATATRPATSAVQPDATIDQSGSLSSLPEPDEATRARVGETFANLPMRFEANQGQTDPRVRYLARGSGYTLFLTDTEATFALQRQKRKGTLPTADRRSLTTEVVRMKLVGANPAPRVAGEEGLSAKTTYLIGNDAAKWHATSNFQSVRYGEVYPGIDLVYYGNQRQLEYDFKVAPGADPGVIKVRFEGVKKLRLDKSGDLLLRTAGGEIRQHKPVMYQEVGGLRKEIAGRFVVKGRREVGFAVGEYDRSKPLVIDPILLYSTYFGGNGNESIHAIAVDNAGNAYVGGDVSLTTVFPLKNEYQSTRKGAADAFVAKLNTNASGAASLLYSTYLGGDDSSWWPSSDVINGIAVDGSGHVYVTGDTYSPSFPLKNQLQGYPGPASADSNAFVTRLDTNASGAASLVYSTYLGGSNGDRGIAIAVSGSGIAYVTGNTNSTNFPLRNEYSANPPTPLNYSHAYVTKLDTNASGLNSLLYSTYLGGTSSFGSTFGFGIDVDSSGDVYVTGETGATDFPLKNEYQGDQPGKDVFVTRLNTNASGAASLVYSTYLGGSSDSETGRAIVERSGFVYVTGATSSTDFPVKNQYQGDQPDSDAFVSQLNTNASGAESLIFSTYLGGDGFDIAWGIAVDSAGNFYVAGNTRSTNFPLKNPYQGDQPEYDVFLTKLYTNQLTGTVELQFSTYLGGADSDGASGIAVDSAGNLYVAGHTDSTNFPVKNQYQGDQPFGDGFVAKFDARTAPTITCPAAITVGNDPGQCDAMVSFNTTVTGDAPVSVVCTIPVLGEFVVVTSPTTFPVGTTTVTCTATNAVGSDTCSFTVTVNDTEKPTLSFTSPTTLCNDLNACGAVVNYNVTANDNCSGALTPTCSPPAGSFFPVGATTINCSATDGAGNTAASAFSVTVNDCQAPVVSCAVVTPILWSPSHNFINVGLSGSATDNCTANPSIQVLVFGDEDDETTMGDGTQSPDAKNIALNTLRLRAERIGGNDGRVYLVVVKATDAAGNVGYCCRTVVVPRDQTQASLANVQAQAASAEAYCRANNGAAPPGYFVIGDGSVIGPKQ